MDMIRDHDIVTGELVVITQQDVLVLGDNMVRFTTRRVFGTLKEITAFGMPEMLDGFDVAVPTTATTLSSVRHGWVQVLLNETGLRAWVAVAFLEQA